VFSTSKPSQPTLLHHQIDWIQSLQDAEFFTFFLSSSLTSLNHLIVISFNHFNQSVNQSINQSSCILHYVSSVTEFIHLHVPYIALQLHIMTPASGGTLLFTIAELSLRDSPGQLDITQSWSHIIQCCCQDLFRSRDLDKMNSSALESRDMGSRSQHWLHQFQLVTEHSLKGATNYGNRATGVGTKHPVLRPRPRPGSSGLETKTETLARRSRDRDRDLDKMNSSALESRDQGLEITTLMIAVVVSADLIASVTYTTLMSVANSVCMCVVRTSQKNKIPATLMICHGCQLASRQLIRYTS